MCYLGGRKREDALDDLPTSEFLNFGQSTHSIKVLKLRISKTIAHQQDAFSSHPKTFSSLQLRHPGPLFRLAVIGTQVVRIVKKFFLFLFLQFLQMVFTAGFTLAYLLSPHFCHRQSYEKTIRCL